MLFQTNLSSLAYFLLSSIALSESHYHSQAIDQLSQLVLEDSKGTFDTVRNALKNSSIIPEVLDDFVPSCFVTPYYAKKHRAVTLGNELKPKKLQQPPALKIFCPHLRRQDVKGLTVVLTDPDAPSRSDPEWSQVCHWIAKIPLKQKGRSSLEGDVHVGVSRGGVEDIVEYKPPGPPPKTGLHRYVFVVLTGENGKLKAPKERKNWGTGKERCGVRDWAGQEGLEVVGANYFVAKNKKQK